MEQKLIWTKHGLRTNDSVSTCYCACLSFVSYAHQGRSVRFKFAIGSTDFVRL